MFTFNLLTADGTVWLTVHVRADSIAAAAATLAGTGMDLQLV